MKTNMKKEMAKILWKQLKEKVASGKISFESYASQKRGIKKILRKKS